MSYVDSEDSHDAWIPPPIAYIPGTSLPRKLPYAQFAAAARDDMRGSAQVMRRPPCMQAGRRPLSELQARRACLPLSPRSLLVRECLHKSQHAHKPEDNDLMTAARQGDNSQGPWRTGARDLPIPGAMRSAVLMSHAEDLPCEL